MGFRDLFKKIFRKVEPKEDFDPLYETRRKAAVERIKLIYLYEEFKKERDMMRGTTYFHEKSGIRVFEGFPTKPEINDRDITFLNWGEREELREIWNKRDELARRWETQSWNEKQIDHILKFFS